MIHFSLFAARADSIVENIQNPSLHQTLEPGPAKVWANAAAVYAGVALEGSQHQPRFVPSIDLITGVAEERKAKEFVAIWSLVKIEWLQQVFSNMAPPRFATRRAWKSFAVSTFSGATIRAHNETTIARIQFAEFLGRKRVLSLQREPFTFFKDDTPGTIDEKVSLRMVKETVAELADLNFFFDLFEVEYRRTYDAPTEITARMQPAMSPFSLTLPRRIPRSKLADRAVWLIRVRDLIRPWHGEKSPDFDLELPDNAAAVDVERLEFAVASIYCSNVTHVLRRRPVLPRYL
jgi:hypothetical protein